jgi:hypothetical protein
MSIRNFQIAGLANIVIDKFLLQGKVPTVNAVIAGIYQILNGHAAGAPLSSYVPLSTNTGLPRPTYLSETSARLDMDLGFLYSDLVDLVNRVVRDFDYKQTQRQRLSQLIVETTSSLENAIAREQNVFTGLISSCATIDMNNTTAFVNFQDYTVELQPAANQTTKIDLRQAKLQWQVDGSKSTVVGDISNIINDVLNTSFLISVYSSGTTANLTITITLPATELVSKATIVGPISSSTVASLQLDGVALPTRLMDSSRRANWEFSPTQIQAITLKLSKNTPDFIDTTGLNRFDFGIQNISCYVESYVTSGIFQSLPIDFGRSINSFTISADMVVPPNCAIAWSYAPASSGTQFLPITLGNQIVFSSTGIVDSKRVLPVRSTRSLASVSNADSDGRLLSATDTILPVKSGVRGSRTPLFNLCSVTSSIQTGNTMVRRGRNAWLVYSYHYSIENAGVIQNLNPSLNDFYQPRGKNPLIYTRYQPADFDLNNQYQGLSSTLSSALRLPASEYPYQSQTDAVMHLFEASLIVDPTLAPPVLAGLAATVVSLPNIFSNGQGAIYCNGKQLIVSTSSFGGALQYSVVMPFTPGQNIIQIVTNNYVNLAGQSFDIGTTLFSSLCVPGGHITWYADPGPMSEVSLFELQYQTARNDFSRFSLVQDPSGPDQLIVVRELPTTVYDVTTTGVTASNNPSSIIVRAALTRSPIQSSLTPKINGYAITVA